MNLKKINDSVSVERLRAVEEDLQTGNFSVLGDDGKSSVVIFDDYDVMQDYLDKISWKYNIPVKEEAPDGIKNYTKPFHRCELKRDEAKVISSYSLVDLLY